MRRSAIARGSFIVFAFYVLVRCVAGTSSNQQGVSGQELTCTESTIDVGCRCSIAPVINAKVIDECSASSAGAPKDTSAHCCEDRLVVNGRDQGVYLCACRAIRCVASEDTCSCDRSIATPLAQGEAVVPNCSGFASSHPAVKCCANGDRCTCTESACGSSQDQVPFCDGASLCVDDIGKRPVDSCR